MIKLTFSKFSKTRFLGQNSKFMKKLWFSASLYGVRVGINFYGVHHDEPCWFQWKGLIFRISGQLATASDHQQPINSWQLAMASIITRHGEQTLENPELHVYSPWRVNSFGRRVNAVTANFVWIPCCETANVNIFIPYCYLIVVLSFVWTFWLFCRHGTEKIDKHWQAKNGWNLRTTTSSI